VFGLWLSLPTYRWEAILHFRLVRVWSRCMQWAPTRNVWTTRTSCQIIMLYRCWPCGQLGHASITFWYIDLHQQSSHCMVLKMPEYCWELDIGEWIYCNEDCHDLIISLCYKLRMFGVPLFGPTNVFCDNQGVVNNTTRPESVLTKKHNQICYHCIREAVAAGIIQNAKEDTATNLADLLTKPLGLPQRHFLLQHILY